ncbi:MAG: hypothetical protein HFI63_03140 [Lachnospiraceae bacterium]|nr:hypothetical protein [Lachnospiraceae bacterium]
MQALDDILTETEEEKNGKRLVPVLLNELIEKVEKKYLGHMRHPEKEINWDGVMIYRRYQTEESKARDTEIFHDSDLANSFFAEDLHMVEVAIGSGDFGKNPMEQAILDYITGIHAEENQKRNWLDVQKRIDV